MNKNINFIPEEDGIVLPLDMQLAINIVQRFRILLVCRLADGSLVPHFYLKTRYVSDSDCTQTRSFIKEEIVGLFNYVLRKSPVEHGSVIHSRFGGYNVSDTDKKKYTNTSFINSLTKNVLKNICDFTNIIKDETVFDNDAYKINTQNGIFDIKQGILLPHTPDKLMRNIVNARYNRKSIAQGDGKFVVTIKRTSLFEKIVSEALYDKTVDDNENREIVRSFLEIIASCLIGNNKFKLLIILVGKSNSGKSTLLNVLREIFLQYGTVFNNNVLMESPRSSNDIRPDIITFQGKRLMLGSESGKKDRFDTVLLKKLSGNDEVSFRKPHKSNMITFKLSGKLLLATNFFPVFTDLDDKAFLNRVVLVNFENVPKNMDTELADKLVQPESRDAIFTLLADIAHKITVKNSVFIHERFVANKERIMINQNSSVPLFWKAHIRPYDKYTTPKCFMFQNPVKVLYAVMYIDFCKRINVKPLPLESFSKEFKTLSDQFPMVSWQKGQSNNFYYGFEVEGGKQDQYYNLLTRSCLDSAYLSRA